MSENAPEPHPEAPAVPAAAAPADDGSDKTVPVSEAIKYRRRAQQAETRLQQVEQTLKDAQSQLEGRLEQLATAEAQRDELQHQLDRAVLAASAERMLHAAGVRDVEAAMALLEKRTGFAADLDEPRLAQAVEQLIVDKPYLATPAGPLPGKTASARPRGAGLAARMARAADDAVRTGSRRAVGEYLRLRRQSQASS